MIGVYLAGDWGEQLNRCRPMLYKLMQLSGAGQQLAGKHSRWQELSCLTPAGSWTLPTSSSGLPLR